MSFRDSSGDLAVAQNESQKFCRQGFAALPQFLSWRETARARELVDSIVRLPQDAACARPHNTLIPLRWNDALVELFLAHEHGIKALREAVGADDLKWISGYVSIKEASSLALWWHQDWWCWDHSVSYRREAPQVAVLCYLADTNFSNGALRVLPGSHRKSAPIHAVLPEAHGHTAENLNERHAAMADLPNQVTLAVRAGDAVVIDYRLLHGTHGNAHSTRRDCILLSFAPSWRRLPDDVQAHLIDHPAQPSEVSRVPLAIAHLFPAYTGVRRSLTLNRNPPSEFEICDET